jgi:hypothetical protein
MAKLTARLMVMVMMKVMLRWRSRGMWKQMMMVM